MSTGSSSYSVPDAPLDKILAAKDTGNRLFKRCARDSLPDEAKLELLRAAVAEYDAGLDLFRRRIKKKREATVDGDAVGGIRALAARLRIGKRKDESEVDGYVEAERALHFNRGVALWHMATSQGIETAAKMRLFGQFATSFAKACKLLELQCLRNPTHDQDSFDRCLDRYLSGFTRFVREESGAPQEAQMGMLAAFVLDLDVRIQDRKFCRPFQRHLAALWLELGQQQFNVAFARVSRKSFRDGLSLMKEVYRSVEEAALYTGDAELEVEELRGDFNANYAIAEALQEAEILSKGADAELLCMSLTRRGLVYLRVLKLRDKAKVCLTEALDIAKTLPGNLYLSTNWYGDLANAVQELRDREQGEEEARWEEQKEQHREEMRELLDELMLHDASSGLARLVDFLFKKCSPVHLSEEARKNIPNLKGRLTCTDKKKALQKLVTMFHPDKVDKEKFGLKHYVLMEEVTKVLTSKYNHSKARF